MYIFLFWIVLVHVFMLLYACAVFDFTLSELMGPARYLCFHHPPLIGLACAWIKYQSHGGLNCDEVAATYKRNRQNDDTNL